MSRIGKLPVNLPAGVTVEVSADNVVSVKGPLGTLSQKVDSDIKVEVGTHKDVHTGNEAPAVLVSRPTNQPRHRSLHGLYRALINNMVVGVSKGYEIKQELVGVGFKAEVKGQILEMSLGYSHDTHFMLPKEVLGDQRASVEILIPSGVLDRYPYKEIAEYISSNKP